jgi:energy-coupling factor transporter transmembrane protein EcfT
MFIEAMILGLVISFLRGGRMDNIEYLNIKGWYLIIIGVVLQLVSVFLTKYSFATYIQLIGIIFVLIVVVLNIKLRGFWLMLFGGMLNFLAVILNGYKMPVNPIIIENNKLSSFMDMIIDGEIINYISTSVGGWSAMLGKIMMTPQWYPFPKMLSIGDIVISIGIIWFIYGETKRKNYRKESKMVQYTYKSRI